MHAAAHNIHLPLLVIIESHLESDYADCGEADPLLH